MKKSFIFVTNGLMFDGDSLIKKSLGGSESALLYMARELAKLGNKVTVYCRCDNPGIYSSVDYRNVTDFGLDEKLQTDVLIVSRYIEFFEKFNIDSKLNILWIHDTVIPNLEISLAKIDKIFCLSEYQKKLYQDRYGIPNEMFHLTTNGFDPTLVKITPFEEKKNNYIYASRYERGLLKLLLDIWPRIYKNNPDARLHICSYVNAAVDNVETPSPYYLDCYSALNITEGVVNIGNLTKPDFYELLGKCAYMLYPTDFPEISCINAIEAQASNCLVITTDDFALPETVKSSTITPIEPQDTYTDRFLSILETFFDPDKYNNEVEFANFCIQPYNWATIANNWNVIIDEFFVLRSQENREGILKQLEYNSDYVACLALTHNQKYKHALDRAALDNLNENYISSKWLFTDRVQRVCNVVRLSIGELGYNLSILDLGGNDGILSVNLLDQISNYIKEVIIYDVNTEALRSLESSKYTISYSNQIRIIQDTIENVQKYDIQPNVILLGEILEHIEDTVGFLTELTRLVKSKCLFVFTTPCGPWESIIKDKPTIYHIHHFEYNDIRTIFQDVNLEIQASNIGILGRRGEPCFNYVYNFMVDADNLPVFYQPDYQDKFIKTRPYKTISGCMIVKNEENYLHNCLNSIYEIVDELIIVDTGSTDNTLDIAQKYTDKIYSQDWVESDGLGNFSAARNYALSKCSGDYILWVDADERLYNPKILPHFIFSDYYDSILLKQRSCILYGDTRDAEDPYHDRLFKRKGATFIGVVHEYVSYDGTWINKALFQDVAYLIHYGTIGREDFNRYDDLIIKNYRTYPNLNIAKSYYLNLLAFQIIKFGKLDRFNEMYTLWIDFIKSGDIWLLSKSIKLIQSVYLSLIQNNVANKILPSLQIYDVTNNQTNETIKIAAVSEQELKVFLSILNSTTKIR